MSINRLSETFRVPAFIMLLNLIAVIVFGKSVVLAQAPSPTHTEIIANENALSVSSAISLDPEKILLQEIANGLTKPVFITNAGDGSERLFIVEQAGFIRIIKAGAMLPTPFLDIHTIVKSTGSEQGLFALAFHPSYSTNGDFYVAYTAPRSGDPDGSNLVLEKFSVSTGDPDQANPVSGVIMLSIAHPTYTNHNGGTLAFGQDEYLYWSTGDGGSGGDPDNNAQNLGRLLGKIIRIDVDNTGATGGCDISGISPKNYAIPAGNPFIDGAGSNCDEIWAYGLRNPWHISFDSLTHNLYIGDVGQAAREEVDFQAAGSAGGENYGWRVMEGSLCYNPSSGCNQSGKTLPVAEYDHTLGCSITGGYVYRGSNFPSLYGRYFYGDYCSGRLFSLYNNLGVGWESAPPLDTPYNISTFGEDEQKELYLANYASGKIYNIGYDEDVTPPTVISSVRANPNPTNATSVSFNITFSEPVTGVNSIIPFDDFALTTTGVIGASIISVTGSGATRTVTVNFSTSEGTIRLDVIDDDSIVDEVGNKLGGTGSGNGNFTTGETYTIDKFATWAGGMVVDADESVVAIGRPEIDTQFTTYNGFNGGSTTVYVPMLFKDAFGGTYDTALYIQNLHASNTATIAINYYDSNGNLTCTINDTIARLSSKGYWLPGTSCLPVGWVGGAVITADQNIVAVGRPHIGSEILTYNGFASGSTTMYVPMLFKDAFGGTYDAALYIQNLHPSTTANIAIKYYDTSGILTCTVNDTLARLSSKGYWLPGTPCLPVGWIGAAVVTASQNIVAVGRPHIGEQIMAYNGFASGLTNAYVPTMFKDASGGTYDSALYVQNVHPTNTANIAIKYYDTAGNLTCTVNDTIARLSSKGYWLPATGCLPPGWEGSVKVESDLGVIAVGRPHLGAEIMTYDGASTGSLLSYVPMLFRDAFGGGYDASIYFLNTDASNSANLTLTFYDANGNLSCTRSDVIPPQGSLNHYLPTIACVP